MRVIVINGPMGVGKTTVGKYIADAMEGTAFIDGDWCMDIHPFVGNSETRAMAVDNILHMIDNYRKCSVCRQIVLVWLMDDRQVCQRIKEGIAEMQIELKSVTLVCDREHLIDRWKNDDRCEWRTEEWLQISLDSLEYFSSLEDALVTDDMSVEKIAEVIMSRTGVTEKKIFPPGQLDDIEFVVIFAKYREKWVYCLHKRRQSFEHPGGHVEAGETAIQAARRELFEESGITDCEMIPLWDYEQPWDDGIHKNNGRVYGAIANSLGELPESEMEKVELFDMLPDNYTYDREEALRDLERAQAILDLIAKWQDFPYGFRFTDENYAMFTPEELSRMSILTEEEARSVWRERCDSEVSEYPAFVAGLNLREFPVLIGDCGWGDAAAEAEAKIAWEKLWQTSEEDSIVVLYDCNTALRVAKDVFCNRWSDFCYPSDIFLLVSGEMTALYYEDIVYRYSL